MTTNKESSTLYGFEDEESVLTNVKINVVLGFVGDVGSEISANKTVPISIVSTVEFILEMRSHLLDCVHFFKSWFCRVKDVSLYFDADVSRLDHWLVLLILLHLISFKLLYSNFIYIALMRLFFFHGFWTYEWIFIGYFKEKNKKNGIKTRIVIIFWPSFAFWVWSVLRISIAVQRQGC